MTDALESPARCRRNRTPEHPHRREMLALLAEARKRIDRINSAACA